ncbi:MAG TPA: helix-turn-helix domain-containing protein [Ktedonobacteraceae bacterium]|nr:helix-turn-helix domain-containing protein [Ktedonobacteraceae bacterium]
MDHWKDRLKQERIQHNWRQQDLADQLGTTVVTVQRWERGSHQPSAYFRIKLCVLFGKSAQELGLASGDVLASSLEETASDFPPEKSDGSQGGELPQDIAGDFPLCAADSPSEHPSVHSTIDPSMLPEKVYTLSSASQLLHRRRILFGLGGLGAGALVAGGIWLTFCFSDRAAFPSARQLPPTSMPLRQRIAHLLAPDNSNWVNKLAWSPDGTYLAVAGGSNVVLVWRIAEEALALTYPTLNAWVNDVSWSTTNWIAAATAEQEGGSLHLWKFPEKAPSLTLKKPYALRSVCWSPREPYFAFSGHTPTIEVWNAMTSRQISHYTHPKLGLLGISRVKWSPSGRLLACAADDGTAHVWEALTGMRKIIYTGHQSRVHDLAWSPDERFIVSCGSDTTSQIWEVSSGRRVLTYRGQTGEIEGVDWSPHGTYIASASADHTAQVWMASTGHDVATYGGYSSNVQVALWSADETVFALGTQQDGVEIWQAPQ